MNTFYLVDCENVGFRHFDVSGTVLLFCSKAPEDFKLLPTEHIALCDFCNGKNALDFCISTELGSLTTKYGTMSRYFIISNDTGYDNVCEYWNNRGYFVHRFNVDFTLHVSESVKEHVESSGSIYDNIINSLTDKKLKNVRNVCNSLGNNSTVNTLYKNLKSTLKSTIKDDSVIRGLAKYLYDNLDKTNTILKR